MKNSEIRFRVELDDSNIPDKIFWEATDGPTIGLQEARAITVSVWDHIQQETLRIDLWGKEMTVEEMKRFYIDTIGGMAQSIRTSTNDEFMSKEIDNLCNRLVEHLKKENKKSEEGK